MGSEVAAQGFPSGPVSRIAPRRRLWSWRMFLLAGVVAAVGCTAVLELDPAGTSAPATSTRHGLTSLPLAAQGPISAALGRDASAYRLEGLRADNPAQHLHARFSRRGVEVASGSGRFGMALSAYGHGSTLRPVGPALPHASANRVRYARGGLTEWYANGPLGIEQGFDIAARPGSAAGPLTLSLALSGNLSARLRDGSVLFTGGGAALRYGGLVATDAHGHVLRSWLQMEDGHVLIRVADRGATYPLRIDPMIQQGKKLTGTGAIGTGRFGYVVALSGDGNTALIGGNYENIGAGAAWVFTRSGSTWSQQGGKLVGTGHVGEGEFAHVGEGEFGTSVALSADGDTALIGAPGDNEDVGAAWVFNRSGSTWTQQGEKLTGTGEAGKGRFGRSVALSADGDTALIGGTRDNSNIGAAWVFTRSGDSWAQQGGKLTGTGEAGQGEFGRSVALSADGNTALIGGWGDDGNEGAAWAFTRSGSTWTQQGGKLTGAGGVGGESAFGTSVALSADGNTALIGGPRDNDFIGAAWVFTRAGSNWAQQGAKLTGAGETGEGRFGVSVALSADGNTAMVGGSRDNSGVGAAWAFTRSGSTWSQQGGKLVGSGEIGAGEFGFGVALSASGDTALIGAPEDAAAIGGTWVLTRSSGVWSEQGPKLKGGEEDNSEFGVLVSLSADGNTALIGGWNDDGRKGAAWVFTRSGGVWSQQGPKLVGAGVNAGDGFGTSVALSADGNTALIGAPGADFRNGAAWVFSRSGSTWTQQGGKLTPAGEVGSPWFGYTVALSGDGNTALIGGWLDDNWKGAAWVFTRSGSTWTQQGGKLTAADEDGEGMFGTNVTLSADGNTALIGGWNDDSVASGHLDYSGKGAAWVFTRSGSTWSQQGPKLTPDDETGNGKFGTIVALSADGDTALIGAWNDDHSKGAAWVFTRSGSTWTQQGPKLTGAGETGEGRFGVAVALSADGNTALVGGLADNSARGAAWLFTRSGSTWTQQGAKLTPVDGAGESEFGTNVALSADGATALIGAWRDNSGTGAAWVFVNPPEPTTAAATNIGETGASLNGALAAGGSSKAYFQYGTTAAYGGSTSSQNVGSSAGPKPLAAAISGLAPGTTYHFRLVAENSGGVAYGDDRTFTTATTGDPAEPPKPPCCGPDPGHLQGLLVQNLRQSKARWRAGNRLATISRARAPIGTTFSFSLNKEATVIFSFNRRVGGRTVRAGRLTFNGHEGTNKVAFQGRVSPKKKLRPGRYTLVITATAPDGARSAPRSLSFTIVK
jgi:FG-GAP repeat